MTQNDIQKNIFLEQKILEFNMGDTHKAQEVYEIISHLKPLGFEAYIIKYFSLYGLDFHHTGNIGKGDNGLDGIGEGIYLQCKKFHRSKDFTASIGISFIRDFYGAFIDDYLTKKKVISKNCFPIGYFVSTVAFTEDAKNFARRNNIELLDYYDVYDMLQIYLLSDFKKSLTQNEREKYFVSSQTSFSKNISPQDITSSDLYFYYREIRKNIAYREFKVDYKNGYIFKDTTLKIFSEKRVMNIENFRSIRQNLSQGEKTKLDKYGKEIERAILLLQN